MDSDQREEPISCCVQCVREVRLPISFDARERNIRFYSELIGMTPWPSSYQLPGGIGLGPPRRGLFLQFAHDADADPMRRRICLTTPSLNRLEHALRERGVMYDRIRSFGWGDSCLMLYDPTGHLLEIRESRRL